MSFSDSIKNALKFLSDHKPKAEWVKKVEDTIKCPFEYIEAGVVVLFFVILYLLVPGYTFANIFTFYPAFFLMVQQFCKEDKNYDKWISFWTVYSFLLVLNDLLDYYLPFYDLIRLIVVTFLYLTNHVEAVVTKVFPLVHSGLDSLFTLIHTRLTTLAKESKPESFTETEPEPVTETEPEPEPEKAEVDE